MARIGAIDKLPNSVRLEIDRRIRARESQRSIALWATGEGHAVSARAVEIHSAKLNKRIEQARDIAELNVATTEVAIASGATTVNIPDTVGYTTPAELGR